MKPDLAKLLEDVERAWAGLDHDDVPVSVDRVLVAVHGVLAALRVAKAGDAVPVLLSREAVEAIREAKRLNEDMEACGDSDEGIDALSAASGRAWTALFRDLADVLK